jgi:hypothetical protein
MKSLYSCHLGILHSAEAENSIQNRGNVQINVIFRRVRVTIVALEEQ